MNAGHHDVNVTDPEAVKSPIHKAALMIVNARQTNRVFV